MELPSAIAFQVMGADNRLIWYDKKSGKVSHANLIKDYCGNARISVGNFKDGYFVMILEPSALAERITEQWLKTDGITPCQKEYLEELLKSLNPNGNDIMMIGRLKQ